MLFSQPYLSFHFSVLHPYPSQTAPSSNDHDELAAVLSEEQDLTHNSRLPCEGLYHGQQMPIHSSRDHTINLSLNLVPRRRPINNLFQYRKLVPRTNIQALESGRSIGNRIRAIAGRLLQD
jgi:hypothetical protein